MSESSNIFSDIPVPSLTLSPDAEPEKVVAEVTDATPGEAPAGDTLATAGATQLAEQGSAEIDDSILTDDEKKMVAEFAKQIDVADSTTILQYGSGAQSKMAQFSQTALESVRTQDLGEVGELITGVVTELKGFDAEEEKGFFGLFKKGKNKLEVMKSKYDKAEKNVDRIVDNLKSHQMTLMKDTATLDKLYELNLSYFKELTMYILAGQQRLAEIRENELAAAVAKAKETGRTEDVQAAHDLESQCTRFEKKLNDLQLTRTIAMQTAPQIRLVQSGENTMIEKIQTTIVNTIPLWKSQMVLALGIANADAAVKAQNAVTEMTNELLRKNADTLQQSTTDIARESERGIVDIETLQHTNEALIKTFDEVLQIQAEGREKRAAAEVEMRRIEGELKAKLLEVSTK